MTQQSHSTSTSRSSPGRIRRAEVEDVSETAGVKTMGEIIPNVSLQNAGVTLAKGAAAIDKFFRDVSDFGDVKMGRDELAVGRRKRGKEAGWSRRKDLSS